MLTSELCYADPRVQAVEPDADDALGANISTANRDQDEGELEAGELDDGELEPEPATDDGELEAGELEDGAEPGEIATEAELGELEPDEPSDPANPVFRTSDPAAEG